MGTTGQATTRRYLLSLHQSHPDRPGNGPANGTGQQHELQGSRPKHRFLMACSVICARGRLRTSMRCKYKF